VCCSSSALRLWHVWRGLLVMRPAVCPAALWHGPHVRVSACFLLPCCVVCLTCDLAWQACIGTKAELEQQYGGHYILELKLMSPSRAQRDRIAAIVMTAHPGTVHDTAPRADDYMLFTLPTVRLSSLCVHRSDCFVVNWSAAADVALVLLLMLRWCCC
jgi:hypothetical protein